MKISRKALIGAAGFAVLGLAHAAGGEDAVCLQVNGENVEIRGLTQEPIVIDRDGTPDFVTTSMMKSVSTATESKSYNILLSGVKRDAKKAISSFTVKVDEQEYSYPKDSCGK
jgi:hypothetical protein